MSCLQRWAKSVPRKCKATQTRNHQKLRRARPVSRTKMREQVQLTRIGREVRLRKDTLEGALTNINLLIRRHGRIQNGLGVLRPRLNSKGQALRKSARRNPESMSMTLSANGGMAASPPR
jgi:hypothetical protein